MNKFALIIGNSDGIGLALTRELLKAGWKVSGISRSPSPVTDQAYSHIVSRVQDSEYADHLEEALKRLPSIDLFVYCAGVGELLDISSMAEDVQVIEVNFLGMIRSVAVIVPKMTAQGHGHVIGLSSVADVLLSAEAPGYHASKAGFSSYLESLALALRTHGVQVSNIRFGFVDTKMAKGEKKPFMIPVERAVAHILSCIDNHPVRMTRPVIIIPLISLRRRYLRLKNFFKW